MTLLASAILLAWAPQAPVFAPATGALRAIAPVFAPAPGALRASRLVVASEMAIPADDAAAPPAPEAVAETPASAPTATAATPNDATTTTMPPDSFRDLIDQVAQSINEAVANGQYLMEVEFPPLPVSKLEDSALSSYDITGANLQLALELSKRLLRPGGVANGGEVALTLPDIPERRRAAEFLGVRDDQEPAESVRMWSLTGGGSEPQITDFFAGIFKQGAGAVTAAPWSSLNLIVGVSCQELPAIRELARLQPTVPLVCFNLKLDTLRGDLGLPAFPPKAVHHEFLSKVMPVYYMRPRAYSLSLSRPPFLLSYQGVLFRRYPEGYQTLLDRGNGKYRAVKVESLRPALGTFKAQLTEALKVSDDTAQSALSQTGFKQSTWWEDGSDEGLDVSKDWRL